MKEFVKSLFELLRSIIFTVIELLFIALSVWCLIQDKTDYSISCAVIAIGFILLETNNRLYDLKKTK